MPTALHSKRKLLVSICAFCPQPTCGDGEWTLFIARSLFQYRGEQNGRTNIVSWICHLLHLFIYRPKLINPTAPCANVRPSLVNPLLSPSFMLPPLLRHSSRFAGKTALSRVAQTPSPPNSKQHVSRMRAATDKQGYGKIYIFFNVWVRAIPLMNCTFHGIWTHTP